MPVYVSELIPNHVLYDRIVGDITVDELHEGGREIANWLNKLDQKTGIVLINVEEMNSFPINVITIQKSLQAFLSHKNLKEIVAYGKGDSIAVKFVAKNIITLFGHNTKFVSNYQQAYQYLIETDPDLEGRLPPNLETIG